MAALCSPEDCWQATPVLDSELVEHWARRLLRKRFIRKRGLRSYALSSSVVRSEGVF